MLDWYQHLPEHINPIVFTVGFFSLYWYAVAYMLALGVSGFVLRRLTREWMSFDRYIDLLFNLVLGVLIGSRLGYVLWYNVYFYTAHPLAIVSPFDTVTGDWIGISGMSFYGGLIGVVVGLWLFARQYKASFWWLADRVAVAVPIGYFFGRLGNFLNGELYGRVMSLPWGMYFPNAPWGTTVLRHPSQLYEAFFEGIVLLVLLLLARKRYFFVGAIASSYMIGYGFFRGWLEFFREPDAQIGFVFGWMTVGQIASAIVCVGGLGIFFWLRKKKYGILKTIR